MANPAQYDTIGGQYNKIKSLPNGDIEHHTLSTILGDITNQRCLDLACGAGHYTSLLHERGASHVVGIDVSEKMIEAARMAYSLNSHLEFHQGDCTKPEQYSSSDGVTGDFDFVFAGYLLNYVATPEEMLKMWQTIHMNMKPGARFLTFVPNLNIDLEKGWGNNNSGLSLTPLEKIQYGWRSRCTVHADPEFAFNTYRLRSEIFENCARQAGMRDFRWIDAELPEDERKENGYWDKMISQGGATFKVIETWR